MLGASMYAERRVLVKGALPGERVQANVIAKSKGAFRAVADRVHRASYQRRQPACDVAPRCGGCSLQHVDASHQLELKRQALDLELRSARVLAPPIGVVETPKLLGYRRRARLGVRHLPTSGETLVGFRESFGSYVVRMDECLTLTPRLGQLITPLKSVIGMLADPSVVPQIELAEGDTAAAVVVRHVRPLGDADESAWRSFARNEGVRVYLQPGNLDTVTLLEAPDGRSSPLSYSLPAYGLDLQFAPTDFLQVNASANEVLVDRVTTAADPGGREVADLFCGLGNFSLPLARRGGQVRGVDFSRDSIERAEQNSRRNGVDQASFRAADLYRDDVDAWLQRFDVAVVDPPRSGMGEHLLQRARSWRDHCRRIVYVSCNPVTFATDVARLGQAGFKLPSVDIVDMFPQTSHVETFGVLDRG